MYALWNEIKQATTSSTFARRYSIMLLKTHTNISKIWKTWTSPTVGVLPSKKSKEASGSFDPHPLRSTLQHLGEESYRRFLRKKTWVAPPQPPQNPRVLFWSVSRRICFERNVMPPFNSKLLANWICWNVLVLVVHKLPNGRLNMMGLFHTVMLGTWNGRNLSFHHLHPPIKPTRHPLQGRTSSTTSPCVILSQASSTAEKKSYPENTKRPKRSGEWYWENGSEIRLTSCYGK